jgi:hypothetical protein
MYLESNAQGRSVSSINQLPLTRHTVPIIVRDVALGMIVEDLPAVCCLVHNPIFYRPHEGLIIRGSIPHQILLPLDCVDTQLHGSFPQQKSL